MTEEQQQAQAGEVTQPAGGYSHPAPDGIGEAARNHEGLAHSAGQRRESYVNKHKSQPRGYQSSRSGR